LVHAKRIRAIILTVCGDSMQCVLGRVRARWCAKQRHRPEQSPRQLQLTLSIHRLAIVRHSDERQSRKAARQDSTSGTRREWRPRTAANWASRTTANWRSRRSLPPATGAIAGHAAYRLRALAIRGRRQAALAVPDIAYFVGPLFGFESATDYPEHMAFREPVLAPPIPVRSLAALHESIVSARLRRPCGSFALEVDGCPRCRRVASDPELAMTGARGRAAGSAAKNLDHQH